MRVGLIARADNTGLGIQSKEFFDHIQCKALVIDMREHSNSPIIEPVQSRFHGQKFYRMPKPFKLTGGIPHRIIHEFLDGLDLVFTMETAYDYNIFTEAKRQGIKTVLQLNYEFLDYPNAITPPDLFAAPSMWNFDQIPDRKTFLPVPVNTKHFNIERKERIFLHIAGRPAYNDRNGTQLLSDALGYVKNRITINVKSQQGIIFRHRNARGINLNLDYSNKENYWENYSGGVLILPRKYGGLCLPMNEALACGMPVIAPDCSPNNLWLPKEWLVPARERGTLNCKRKVPMYEVNPRQLALKIDEFCDTGFYNQAVDKAIQLRDTISWDTLLPKYHKTFEEVCS